MNTTIVVTCGTSLLTNFMRGKKDPEADALIRKVTNEKDLGKHPKEVGEKIHSLLDEAKGALDSVSIEGARAMSAELNGLITYYGGVLPSSSGNKHYLICSDTEIGQSCANIVKKWFDARGLHAEVVKIPDLTTASREYFPHAMGELAKWCIDYLEPIKAAKEKVVFSLVGGFKAFLGFMQTLGMLYADETVYMFEGTEELLSLPSLPIDIDAGTHEVVRKNINPLRILAVGYPLPEEKCSGIPEIMIIKEDGMCALSSYGEIIFNSFRRNFYGKELLPTPLPDKIIYTDSFMRSLENNTIRAYMSKLNERIDDLARYLLIGKNVKRFDIKKLSPNITSKCVSTHEIDLWSTGGAWRLFCHFDGDKCYLDLAREHL